jgi:hypothetical protein
MNWRKRKMAKCKVCGKQIPRGRIVCDECTEALRMQAPTADKIKPWEMAQASVMKGLMDDPFGDATPTQRKIREITEAMKDLLLYKNQKYGDSAINPEKIFYKGDSTSSILIRLNDKIGRVKANPDDKPRVNDVCDIIGYCTLLLISMGVTAEDIAKFKD